MARLAFIYDDLFTAHIPAPGHPESPQRLQRIMAYLKNKSFFNRADLVKPVPATIEQLQSVHNQEYIQFVLQFRGCESAVLDEGDTSISKDSVDAALLAAGCGIRAVDLILDAHYDKVFCALRPPGHHARAGKAMGFCIFNNAAVCVNYALSRNFSRILIVDWDVHHGNGTQEIFYTDDRVYYLSLHRFPFFPLTGSADETGQGKGKGFNLNIPLAYGQDDQTYVHILDQALQNIGQHFSPDLVIISAGFDAHILDPIGGMRVSNAGFYKLSELVSRFAQKHSNGQIISFLEGGYHYQALAESVNQHLNCLLKH